MIVAEINENSCFKSFIRNEQKKNLWKRIKIYTYFSGSTNKMLFKRGKKRFYSSQSNVTLLCSSIQCENILFLYCVFTAGSCIKSKKKKQRENAMVMTMIIIIKENEDSKNTFHNFHIAANICEYTVHHEKKMKKEKKYIK